MRDADLPVSSRRRRRTRAVHTWVTTLAALAALAISVFGLTQLPSEEPRTEVGLPKSLQMAWEGGVTSVFLQPTVSTRFDAQNVEMVNDVQLRLRPDSTFSSRTMAPRFAWLRTVKWTYREDKEALWYEFLAHPAPFTVTQEQPHQPYIQFFTPVWNFVPGRYTGTLTVERASDRKTLVRSLCVVLNQGEIDLLQTMVRGQQPYEFRSDVAAADADACYHFSGVAG
ncbi:hypothetical protein ACGFX2_02955 [Streptomyces goshikiensis]|uniref:hypothetical protein n=1 Tax=Streptomyces goshikiensis TaxID=1942 RepID=UPI0037198E7C